jgi:AraC-like DNA-binding protein
MPPKALISFDNKRLRGSSYVTDPLNPGPAEARRGHSYRSAPGSTDWVRYSRSCRRLERVEAFFSDHAFDSHRHDTYVIGFTLEGVQSFRYRNNEEHCVPGQVFVLHPDERHDGHAGTSAGFHYKSLYIDPNAIHEALDDSRGPLPFVRDVVSTNRRIASAIRPALSALDDQINDLQCDEVIVDVADALAAADRSVVTRKLALRDWRAVRTARDFLDANVRNTVTSSQLEAIAGLSRYALARQFRACLGTSPSRYLILRRLDRVCSLLEAGSPLMQAALACNFADQSHMTRHFKRTFGMSPGRWISIRRDVTCRYHAS